MARVPRSRFINRVALQKALTSIKFADLLRLSEPVGRKASRKFKRIARRNAPVKTGKLRRGINNFYKPRRSAGRGKIATFTTYSHAIQDKIISRGIPNTTLSAPEATKRSRIFNGTKHRLKAGFNYTKSAQKTKTGKISKRRPIGKDGRPWAFGLRRKNEFMTRNQTFEKDIQKSAIELGNSIRREFAKTFARNIKVSIGGAR